MRRRDPALPTREAVFAFLVKYKREHNGNAPGRRSIMAACGITSTSVVSYHLSQLEKMGRVRMAKGASHGIEVVGGEWTFHEEFTEPAVDK